MVAETITDRVMQPRLAGTIYLAPEQVFVVKFIAFAIYFCRLVKYRSLVITYLKKDELIPITSVDLSREKKP